MHIFYIVMFFLFAAINGLGAVVERKAVYRLINLVFAGVAFFCAVTLCTS